MAQTFKLEFLMRNFGDFILEILEPRLGTTLSGGSESIKSAGRRLKDSGDEIMGREMGELEVEIHRKIDGQPEFRLKEK